MFIEIFMKIKVYLILVTIHEIQIFFDPVNKIVIGKMKFILHKIGAYDVSLYWSI